MRALLISVMLGLLAFNSNANTYYLSSNGDDVNDGLSQNTAWQSISKVNSFSFAAGDTIAFEGGSTFSGHIHNTSFSNATESSRITITSYGNGWATISSGMYQEGISIVNAGNITISRLFLKCTNNPKDSVKTIYYNGVGVWLDSHINMFADNIVIDSIEVSGYGGFGIMMSCDSKTAGYRHVRITNSVLHDNSMGGLQITGYSDSASHLFSHSDVYVGYCKAFNNFGKSIYTYNWSGCGILVSGLEKGLLEYCEAYNNGKENGCRDAGPVGIFLGDARYVTIQHCTSHHNATNLNGKKDGGGFDLDQGSYGCVIQHCNSYENQGAGYGIYQARTTNPFSNDTIRYNTSTNDGRNFGFYGSFTFWSYSTENKLQNVQIYGNKVVLNKPGYALTFVNPTNVMENSMQYNDTFCLEPPASFLNFNREFPVPTGMLLFNNIFPCTVQPQQSFILPVPYRGAFSAAPDAMWTNSWTNYNPQSTTYGNPDSVIETAITSSITLLATKKYLIKGPVFVTNGAVLSIQPGTLIRADKGTPTSALIITKGSRIKAPGTHQKPIIFTSNQAPGQRANGDWAGIFLLGKAGYNGPEGLNHLNGFPVSPDTEYGGGYSPNDNDSSGVMQYVRIEFAGSSVSTSQKNDGFTMAGVGKGTILDHIQVSFSNNDGFKWLGGAVNCRYLVSYKNGDDNWDAGSGYHGAVQFALGLKDPSFFTSENSETAAGTESGNLEPGSTTVPFTNPLFCNFTDIGPLRGNNSLSLNGYKQGVKYFNNSRARFINSIVMDYPSGIEIAGIMAVEAASENFVSQEPVSSPANLVFKNNIVAGSHPNKVLESDVSWNMAEWFGKHNNDSLPTSDTILISPYTTGSNNSYIGDYRPRPNSAALKNYNWNDSSFYYIDSTGIMINLIDCPVSLLAPSVIIGSTNSYPYIQSGDTVIYYLTTKSNQGILRYNWTVPAGVTIESGQGTDTLVVRYSNSFISGNISVSNYTYCGISGPLRSLAIKKTAPKVYTFTGNGYWNNAANWLNGSIPPAILPFNDEIIIDHAVGGSCILNTLITPQTISKGAKLTVQPGKNLLIEGNLDHQ